MAIARMIDLVGAVVVTTSCALAPLLAQAQTAELPSPASFHVGDSWQWRQVDTRTRQVETTLSRSVTAGSDGVPRFLDGVSRYDITKTLVNGSGNDESSKPWRAWPLAVSKRWKFDGGWSRRDGVTGTTQQDVGVVAYEEVTVPAGTFMAFKVEHKGFYRNSNGASGKQLDTYWYSPEALCDVRHDRFDGVNSYTQELTSYRLGSATAAPSGSPAPAAMGPRLYLDEKALTARFVGKTAHLKRYADSAARDLSFKSDGSATMVGGGGKGRARSGTWQFDDGKMCVQFDADSTCFVFFEEQGVLKAGPRDDAARWQVTGID